MASRWGGYIERGDGGVKFNSVLVAHPARQKGVITRWVMPQHKIIGAVGRVQVGAREGDSKTVISLGYHWVETYVTLAYQSILKSQGGVGKRG